MEDLFAAVLMLLPMFAPFFEFFLAFGLRRRDCPGCERPLSPIQSPFKKTRRQWAEGGYLCGNCGCETDLKGKKVAPGTGPRPGWMVLNLVLVAAPAVVGVVLLFFVNSLGRQEPGPPLAPVPAPRLIPDPPVTAPAPAEPGH